MKYQSKKDLWLVLVMSLGLFIPFILGVVILLGTSADRKVAFILFGSGLVIGGLIFWLSYPLYYEISDSYLLVRSGPLKWQIQIKNIDGLVPTRNALSSPAMSLDRLAIKYREQGSNKMLLISPLHKNEFIRELASSDPQLQVVGNTLKRQPG